MGGSGIQGRPLLERVSVARSKVLPEPRLLLSNTTHLVDCTHGVTVRALSKIVALCCFSLVNAKEEKAVVARVVPCITSCTQFVHTLCVTQEVFVSNRSPAILRIVRLIRVRQSQGNRALSATWSHALAYRRCESFLLHRTDPLVLYSGTT